MITTVLNSDMVLVICTSIQALQRKIHSTGLPRSVQMEFEVLVMIYKALNGLGEDYIRGSPLTPCHTATAVVSRFAHPPHCKREGAAGRVFSVRVPGLCN